MTIPPEDIVDALARCAREPIHVPGAIQPHGCLLVFDAATRITTHASANVESFLGRPLDSLLGRVVSDWMSVAEADQLDDALRMTSPDGECLLAFESTPRPLVGAVHVQDGVALLELEPGARGADGANQAAATGGLRRLAAASDLQALADTTTDVVRKLVGFDRVVIYRFAEDGSGEVVAERRVPELDPFLGLRFPESDIPRQARELYLKGWIRAIPDARYAPCALQPALRAEPHAQVDLSLTALRSISPMHLTYLANMGVQASLSASLIVEGRLWGLISCGHRVPSPLPPALRSTCETIARMVSSQIGALEEREWRRRTRLNAPLIQILDEAMRVSDASVLEGVACAPDSLLALVAASGAAVVVKGEVTCFGSCPAPDDVQEISAWASQRGDACGLWRTAELGQVDPAWGRHAATASSVLVVALPKPLEACLLWFRPELVRSVKWGGKPPIKQTDAASWLLGPERSFAVWSETVRGCGEPWDEADLSAVQSLRRLAIEIDLGREVVRHQAAVQARDDLVAVVSHDLRTPMSIVAMQASIIQRVVAVDPTEASHRLRASAQTIQRAADRMNSLLQDLLDLAKIEAGRFEVLLKAQSSCHVIDDACTLLSSIATSKGVELNAEETTDELILVDPERIFQVLSNLIGNAVKFSSPDTMVIVGGARVGQAFHFHVTDEGVGITQAQQARIFDRYWQAKQSNGGGAGLGLYIAKGIVEAHGGTLWLTSEVGRGTSFHFSVPVV